MLAKLRKGAKVEFLKDHRGWWLIRLANGRTGFVYRTYLAPYSNAKVGKLYKSKLPSGKLLPARSKPNAKAKVVVKLRNTTTLVLLSKNGTWGLIRVVATGKVGYVDLGSLKAVN